LVKDYSPKRLGENKSMDMVAIFAVDLELAVFFIEDASKWKNS